MQIKGFNRNIRYGQPLLLFLVFLLSPLLVKSQSFDLVGNKKRMTMPFLPVRDMIVVSLKINDKGPFNFVLDTGMGLMLITDPTLVDSLDLPSKRTIKIFGLNGKSYEAYVTPDLKVDIHHVTSTNVAAAILKEDHFGLSNYAGMHIHGLLGYEFFSNLAVKFNFNDSTLSVSKPQYVRLLRKGVKIPLTIEDRKPYINTTVKMPDGATLNRKLIVDIGAGHPLSLENMMGGKGLPSNFITANLGMGLTGPITGYISRVAEIDLAGYKLKNVITAFPDQENLKNMVPMVPRDGNLGIGLLKRFTVILDYANNAMYLKKGAHYGDKFEHDMTGMEYYFAGLDFSHLVIGRIEPGSAADAIGLKPTDEILAINFKPIADMSIDEVDNIFKAKDGRNLLLEIYRNKQHDNLLLTLKKRI